MATLQRGMHSKPPGPAGRLGRACMATVLAFALCVPSASLELLAAHAATKTDEDTLAQMKKNDAGLQGSMSIRRSMFGMDNPNIRISVGNGVSKVVSDGSAASEIDGSDSYGYKRGTYFYTTDTGTFKDAVQVDLPNVGWTEDGKEFGIRLNISYRVHDYAWGKPSGAKGYLVGSMMARHYNTDSHGFYNSPATYAGKQSANENDGVNVAQQIDYTVYMMDGSAAPGDQSFGLFLQDIDITRRVGASASQTRQAASESQALSSLAGQNVDWGYAETWGIVLGQGGYSSLVDSTWYKGSEVKSSVADAQGVRTSTAFKNVVLNHPTTREENSDNDISAAAGGIMRTAALSANSDGSRTGTVLFAGSGQGSIFRLFGNNPKYGIEVLKGDDATGMAPQGDASLGGIEFEVVYEGDKPIALHEKTYRKGDVVVGSLKTDAAGRAATSNRMLPAGTYTVREKAANASMRNGGFRQTVQVGQGVSNGSMHTVNAADPVVRGGVKLQKVDAETGKPLPLGSADLKATFEVRNASKGAVVVGGTLFAPGATVKSVTAGEDGSWTSAADWLPYGTYEVVEKNPPAGYLAGAGTKHVFQVREHAKIVELSSTGKQLSFENQVKRGDYKFTKRLESTQSPMGRVAFLITSQTTGESHVVVTDPNGMASTEQKVHSRANKVNASDEAVSGYEIKGKAGAKTVDVSNVEVDDSKLDFESGIWFGTNAPAGGVDAPVSTKLRALPYDDYLLNELPCAANVGTELIENLAFTVYRDDVTDGADNGIVDGGALADVDGHDVRVLKVGEDGEPLVGAKMQIANGNGKVVDTWTTDGKEHVAKVRDGSYTLREVFAPEGYRLAKAVNFDVTRAKQTYLFKVVDKFDDGKVGYQLTAYKDSDPPSGSKVQAGDAITYKISAKNTGASSIPYTYVRDYIPEHTSYVNGSVTSGGKYVATSDGGYVEWVVKGIAANASVDGLSYQVTVDEAAQQVGYVENTALYGYGADDPGTPGRISSDPPRETNKVIHVLDEEAQLAVLDAEKTSVPAPGTPVEHGGRIDYTVTVRNNGSGKAQNVGIRDYIPNNTTYVEESVTAEYSGVYDKGSKRVDWVVPEIDPGQSVTVGFSVTVDDSCPAVAADGSPYLVVNQALFENRYDSSSGADPKNKTNITEHPLFESGKDGYQVTVYKGSDPASGSKVEAGGTITYKLEAKNTGAATVPYTVIRDYIPEHASYVPDSVSAGGVYVATEAGGYVEWVIEGIAANTVAPEVSYKVTVDESALGPRLVENTALYGCSSENPGAPGKVEADPPRQTNKVIHVLDDNVKLAVLDAEKNAQPAPGSVVARGETIVYTVTVKNAGTGTAENVGVRDYIPEHTTYVDGSASKEFNGAYDLGRKRVDWVVPRIEAGQSESMSFAVTVDADCPVADESGAVYSVANQALFENRFDPNDGLDPKDSTNVVEHPLEELPEEPKTPQSTTPDTPADADADDDDDAGYDPDEDDEPYDDAEEPVEGEETDGVKTGDALWPIVWVTVVMVAATAAGVASSTARRRKEAERAIGNRLKGK